MASRLDDPPYPFKGHKSFIDAELIDLHDNHMYTGSQSDQLNPRFQSDSLNKYLINDSILGLCAYSYAETCDLTSFIHNVHELREPDDDEFIPNPEGRGLEKDHISNSQLSDRLGQKWSFEVDQQNLSAFDTNGTSNSAQENKSQNKSQRSSNSSRGLERKTTDGGSSSPCTVSLSCQSEQAINHNHSVNFNSIFSTGSDFPIQKDYLTPPFDSFLNVRDIEGALQRFEDDNKKLSLIKEKQQANIILSSPITSTPSYKTDQESVYVDTRTFNTHIGNTDHSNILTQNNLTNKTLTPYPNATYSMTSINPYQSSNKPLNVPAAPSPVLSSPSKPQNINSQSQNSLNTYPNGGLMLFYNDAASNVTQFAVSTAAHRNAQIAANSLCQMKHQELLLALMITREALAVADASLKQSFELLANHSNPSKNITNDLTDNTNASVNNLCEVDQLENKLVGHLSNLIESVVSSISVLIPGYLDAVSNEGYNISVDRSPIILAHPDEFKNPSSFLKVYGDPHCSLLNQTEKQDLSDHPRKGKDGNWECSQCHNVNYPRRFRCNNQACRSLRDVYGDKVVSEYTRHVFYTYLVNMSQKKKNIFERYGTNGIEYLITQTLPRKKNTKHSYPQGSNYHTIQSNQLNYKTNNIQDNLVSKQKKFDPNFNIHSNKVIYKQKADLTYTDHSNNNSKLNKTIKMTKHKQNTWNPPCGPIQIPFQSPDLYMNKNSTYPSVHHRKNRKTIF